MVQGHFDIARTAIRASASTASASTALTNQLNHIAAAINAKTLILVSRETASGHIYRQVSVPPLLQDVSEEDLLALFNATCHRAIAHPEHTIQDLSDERQFNQRHAPQARSSSEPHESSYRYGSIVDEQATSIRVVLLEMPQPLTSEQTLLLEIWISSLKHTLAMEWDRQRQQAKIALLEQVIQHTAHQVRQPLSLIELYTDVLSSLPVNNSVRSQLDLIRSATADLDQHLQHLANYGMHNALQLEHHGLQEIWANSLEQVRPWADKKHLRIVNTSTPICLTCDRWQMGQVFNNLLLNAIHFSPVGGTITCHWQRFQEEVLIELWDEGPGIDEDDLPKIFMPFHSRRQGGTGIGLSVVKKIVLDHQGQCWATNLPSGGAKFSFTINAKSDS